MQIIQARRADIGGLEVARVLPFRERRMVGPYIFLDHAGPIALAPDIPRTRDVLPHPHIGLATVSYLFAGELVHRDGTGAEQTIRPGEVNWMTAGRGVSHSERFEGAFQRSGGRLELLQAWVALPDDAEETDPDFRHHGTAALPEFAHDGAWGRLIAGEAFGARSPVAVRSPQFYLHLELDPGGRAALPTGHAERAVYVVRGEVTIDGHPYTRGQMAVFGAAEAPDLRAERAATVVMLGGEAVGPRHIWWNFVSSSKDRIEAAKADWQAGRIALPYHDGDEFVPLPAPTSP